jgi:pimeloyl-ACP methyl ester carboxylesterase
VAASELIKPGLTAQQGFELGGDSSMDLAPADLRVVLLVGTLDPNPCTSPDVTRDFAEALETNGIDAQLVEVVGAGHEDVILPHTDPGRNTIDIIESILVDLEDS